MTGFDEGKLLTYPTLYALYFEAEKRMVKANNTFIPADEVLSGLGIKKTDLDDVEVEID